MLIKSLAIQYLQQGTFRAAMALKVESPVNSTPKELAAYIRQSTAKIPALGPPPKFRPPKFLPAAHEYPIRPTHPLATRRTPTTMGLSAPKKYSPPPSNPPTSSPPQPTLTIYPQPHQAPRRPKQHNLVPQHHPLRPPDPHRTRLDPRPHPRRHRRAARITLHGR